MTRPKHSPQLNFDYLLGQKKQFRIREAAAIIGMSPRFTEALFDEGKQLSGHEHNAGAGRRKSKTIPREWLIAYLIKTAQYDHAMRLQMAREVHDSFSEPTDLLSLRNYLTQKLNK